MYSDTQKQKIILLNDSLRSTFQGAGGRVVITQKGIHALPENTQTKIFDAVKTVQNFEPDTDKEGLHEHGQVHLKDENLRVNFNINYFERNAPYINYGSQDPSDTDMTTRVLAISIEGEDTAQLSENWVAIYPKKEFL